MTRFAEIGDGSRLRANIIPVAYSLVLEQFHHAVVDRRDAISGTAAGLPRMPAR